MTADRRTWLRRYIILCWIILGMSALAWPVAAIILYENVPVIVFVIGWIANVLIATRMLFDAYLRNGNEHNSATSRGEHEVQQDE